MSKADKIIAIVEKIAKPIVQEYQLELVDVEFTKEGENWFLRVIIDKDGGIDIDDCGRISEQISKKLDTLDPIDESYFLEVCSPGAERPLKTVNDIIEAIGEYVHIKTNIAIEGQTEFEGILIDFNNDIITLNIEKKQLEISYQDVTKIRLGIKF
jgi:ribosome maturation factor RimP